MRALRVQLVEARGAGSAGAHLVAKQLEAAAEKHAMILDIVEKEKTIKSLWHPATPGFQRAAAHVAQLVAQLQTLGVGESNVR